MENELYHHGIKGMRWGVRRFQNADGSYTSAGKARYNVNTSKEFGGNGVVTGNRGNAKLKMKKAVVTAATVSALHKDPYKAKPKNTDISKMSDKELREANARANLERKYKENQKQNNKVRKGLEATRNISNETSNISNRTREYIDRSNARANRQRPMKRMDLSHMSDQELRDRINRGNLERQYTQMFGTPQEARGRDHVAATLDTLGTVLAIGGSAASIALTIHELTK